MNSDTGAAVPIIAVREGSPVHELTLPRRLAALAALTFLAALAVPLTVAFDSYLYVQSSRHVFSESALVGYHWIREPLYPLIIKAVRVAGGSADVWLIWAQLGALALASFLAAQAILGRRPVAVSIAVLATMLNPMLLGYAGAVLQTSWITLVVAMHCAFAAAAWRSRNPSAPKYLLSFVGLTIASSYLAFHLGYLSFASGFVLGLAILVKLNSSRHRQGRPGIHPLVRVLGVVLAAGVVGVLGVMISQASLLPWNAYKERVTGGAASDELGLGNTYSASPQEQLRTMITDPGAAVRAVSTTTLQLLGLSEPRYAENAIFGTGAFHPDRRCGKLYWAETIPGPVADTTASLQPTCKSRVFHSVFRVLVGPGTLLYLASSIAFLIGPLILLGLRRWEVLLAMAPAGLLVFMYAARQLAIDRYGIPVYPIAASLMVLFGVMLVDLLRRSRSSGLTESTGDETTLPAAT